MSPAGKGSLRIAIEDFFETFDIREIVWRPVKHVFEQLEEEGLEYYEQLYNQFEYKQVVPDMFTPSAIRSQLPRRPVQIVPILIGIGMMFLGVVIGAFQPAQRAGSYKIDRFIKSGRPSPLETWSMILRQKLNENKGIEFLLDQGFDDETIEGYKELSKQKLTAREYILLYKRGFIALGDLYEKLLAIGYDLTEIKELDELGNLIPGVGDLVSMAVREAWNDDAARRFGYDEGFPPEFGEWLTKQGLSEDWAKRYWRQHWQLPGVQQVFEMYQRLRTGQTANTFSDADLADYLKAADIPVFYRERLKEIAYAPLTRVDIRRMFAVGVLSADEVYQAYRDIGYDDTNAKLLTDFTTKVEKAEEKGLTRAAIQDAYRRGLWTKQASIDMLDEIGYTPEDAAFWIALVDNDFQNQANDAKLAAIETLYVNGYLDDTTVYGRLGPLNLPSERVTALLELWNARKLSKVNIPSRSELDDFLRRNIIDDNQYREYLKRDGYQQAEIELFVRRIDEIIKADADQLLAEQQAEQERLDRANKSTEYQKTVAGLNVEIAQNNAAIADIKVVLHEQLDDETKAAYKAEIDYLKLANAEINVKKAEARKLLINQ